ncbi:MAG: hypothetical protein M1829_000213 [Trizodia sp. TS-e1964]|nr:MAG: hypothetical protein M1829_000213 [Trizodia sp. TS-e1964]
MADDHEDTEMVIYNPIAAPLDLSHHYSHTTCARKPSQIKDFYRYFAIPNIDNLAAGMPHAELFPFDTLEAQIALPERFQPIVDTLSSHRPNTSAAQILPETTEYPVTRIVVPKVSPANNAARKIDVTTALQYGATAGYTPLLTFLRQFTRENLHPNVPYIGGPEIVLTNGATDGFNKTLETFSDTWFEGTSPVAERQGMLCEEFTYMNAIQAAAPRGLQIVPVAMDHEGMMVDNPLGLDGPRGLAEILHTWPAEKGKRPHLLYTVTIGQNPTSATLPVPRRKQIYKLCQQYDIIIIEDDPYWYLQFPAPDTGAAVPETNPDLKENPEYKSSGYEFLDSLVPSYLSIDIDGRVIRLDSFSKTVAPGCRLGWITAQQPFIERILRYTEVSTQQPSGFVQSIIAQMLIGPAEPPQPSRLGSRIASAEGKPWDVSGFVRWLEGLRGVYDRRMRTMCTILEEGRFTVRSRVTRASKPADAWSVVDNDKMFDFDWPRGGMFVWLKLNLASHPLSKKTSHAALGHSLWVHLTEKPYLVLLAPGTMFCSTPELAKQTGPNYFRICFAPVEEAKIEEASHRLVKGFQTFWKKRDVQKIETTWETAQKQGCSLM